MRLSLGSVGFPGLWCPCPARSSWSSCSPVGQSPWEIWHPLENFGHWWAQWSWSLMASPSSICPLCWWPGLWRAGLARKGFATSQTWATFQTWPLVTLCLLCSIHRARAFSMWSFLKPQRPCQLGIISICQKRKLRLRKEQKFTWQVAELWAGSRSVSLQIPCSFLSQLTNVTVAKWMF